MSANPLRDLLNTAAWHTRDLDTLRLHVVSRGNGPDGFMTIPGEDVLEIRGDGVCVRPFRDAIDMVDGYQFIPYHRIKRIEWKDGLVMWERT